MKSLMAAMPVQFEGFHEVFAGGAALTFALASEVPGNRVRLNDSNGALITTYTVVRDRVNDLVAGLAVLNERRDEADFLKVRSTQPTDAVAIAARFIYLNRTCFNGLHRVNAAGKFNVPFGHLDNPIILDSPLLRSDSSRLIGATIRNESFEEAVLHATKGDFVYLDPPYLPASGSANFTRYDKAGFSLQDQQNLADCIGMLTKKGVHVMMSNSDSPLTREIFRHLEMYGVSAPRSIAAKSNGRTRALEVIAVNYPAEL